MTDLLQPRTLGLVTGLGMGAGIFYYRSLVNAHLARGVSPRIVMVHADVQYVMKLAAAGEARQLAEYLTGLLHQLANAGAEFAVVPAFAPQICAQELGSVTPLPLISLLDAIADEIDRRGLKRIALFGARVTIETKLFGHLQDHVEVITPDASEVDRLSEIYARVVQAEQASPQDYESLRALAHTLIKRERLDAILFAGTDLSLVFNPSNADFPHLDGARIHIDAIMRQLLPR